MRPRSCVVLEPNLLTPISPFPAANDGRHQVFTSTIIPPTPHQVTNMPPKVTVTPDEDVKFLLTIIKLAGVGTVRLQALTPIPSTNISPA